MPRRAAFILGELLVTGLLAVFLAAYSLLAFLGASSNQERLLWAVLVAGSLELEFVFLLGKPPLRK